MTAREYYFSKYPALKNEPQARLSYEQAIRLMEEFAALPKKHDTIVCGWDSEGNLKYIRTFNYENSAEEKALAQQAMNFCSHNYASWLISDTNEIVVAPKVK